MLVQHLQPHKMRFAHQEIEALYRLPPVWVSAQIHLLHSRYHRISGFGMHAVKLLVRDGLLHGIVQPFKDISDYDDMGMDVGPRSVRQVRWLDEDGPGLAEDLQEFEDGGCRLGEDMGSMFWRERVHNEGDVGCGVLGAV